MMWPRWVRFPPLLLFQYWGGILNAGQIDASKMLIRMRNVGFTNHSHLATTLRSVFAQSQLPGFVYESTFMLVDQESSTINNLIQNVIAAVLVMLVITFIFIPQLLTAIWIGSR
jgi:hypothetical protein